MKKLVLTALLLCFGFACFDDAFAGRGHRGHRGGVSVGVAIGPYWGWGPRYYPPPLYYPYDHHPVIIERPDPPIYIEQSPPTHAIGYWYYCQSPSGYYPSVKECPTGWLKVPPQP